MQEFLTPPYLALAGGLVGGLRTAARSNDSILLGLTDILVGCVAAVGASTYVPANAPLSALLIGLLVGRCAGYATDTIYSAVPQIIPMVIKFIQSLPNKENDK